MNIFFKKALSYVLTISMFSAALGAVKTAYAEETDTSVSRAQTTELKSENISYEYVSAVYNGQAQKPKVTVRSNGAALTEGTDYTVSYPEDCTNAGVKTVSISGIGNYSGNFSATYLITSLDVSGEDVEFSAAAQPCVYSGLEIIPDFTVKANGITIPSDCYTVKCSNNIKASAGAVCEFTFKGNFAGKRQTAFTISKAARDDIDIEIPARPGERITYDLSALLPDGARFDTPRYFSLSFPDGGKPTIAFNELRLTCGDLTSSSTVSIPVIGADNFTEFYVNFYFEKNEKIVPTLVMKPIIREYNGKEITADDIISAGCYAEVNGVKIDGEWTVWRSTSVEPHTALPCSVTFDPSDERYASVEGVAFITIDKVHAKNFSVVVNRDRVELGKNPILTVTGYPEERKDELCIECDKPDGFSFTEYHSPYQNESELRFKLDFPYNDGIYTVTASLPEDKYNSAVSGSCTITVGDYVPPEEQIPDKVTTDSELSEMISAAPMNGFITAEGMRSVSKANIAAAAAKRITLEVRLNDTYTWVLKTEKLNTALDLKLGSAAIPVVLTEKIGGVSACSFTISEKNLSADTELRVTLNNSQKNGFANLFYYNSNGELDFVSCARVEADNTAELTLAGSGKYVVITDTETKMFGDIDNNRVFNLQDITTLLNAYVNNRYSPGKLYKYDINRDGEFRLNDITALLSYYVNH